MYLSFLMRKTKASGYIGSASDKGLTVNNTTMAESNRKGNDHKMKWETRNWGRAFLYSFKTTYPQRTN